MLAAGCWVVPSICLQPVTAGVRCNLGWECVRLRDRFQGLSNLCQWFGPRVRACRLGSVIVGWNPSADACQGGLMGSKVSMSKGGSGGGGRLDFCDITWFFVIWNGERGGPVPAPYPAQRQIHPLVTPKSLVPTPPAGPIGHPEATLPHLMTSFPDTVGLLHQIC